MKNRPIIGALVVIAVIALVYIWMQNSGPDLSKPISFGTSAEKTEGLVTTSITVNPDKTILHVNTVDDGTSGVSQGPWTLVDDGDPVKISFTLDNKQYRGTISFYADGKVVISSPTPNTTLNFESTWGQ